MRHNHDADVNIKVDIPTQDIERLIDKTTDAVITVVAVVTAAHILKSFFVIQSGG